MTARRQTVLRGLTALAFVLSPMSGCTCAESTETPPPATVKPAAPAPAGIAFELAVRSPSTLLTEIRGQVKNMMGGIFDVEWATKYLGGIDPDASSAMILYEQASEGTRWGSLSSPQDIRKGVVAAL